MPNRCIIGADVAEGLADGDFDAAAVIDAATGKQIAALRGRWPPDIFAHKLYQLGERYGFPLLAVERNNHGHACLLKLQDLHYPKLYHHEDALKADGHEEPRAGWVTTRITKPLIIDALAAALRDDTYHPMDPILIAEALVFSYQNNGTMSAPEGFHDDTVIAHAIAVYIASQPDAILATKQLFADLERMKRPELSHGELQQ